VFGAAQACDVSGLGSVSVQVPQEPVVHAPVEVLQVTVLVCLPQVPQNWLSAGFVPESQLFVQEPLFQSPHVPPVQLAEHVLVAVPPL